MEQPVPQATSVELEQFESWARSNGWDLECLQLEGGYKPVGCLSGQVGAIGAQLTSYSGATAIFGRSPEDGVQIAVPLEGECTVNGWRVDTGHALVIGGGRESEFRAAPGLSFLSVFVGFDVLEELLTGADGEPPDLPEAPMDVVPLRPAVAAVWRRLAFDAAFDSSAGTVGERSALLQSLVVDTLAPATMGTRALPQTRAARLATARAARVYLDDHFRDPLRLADLAVATQCGTRTLQRGFREMYGLGPMQYLKVRRLHEARRLMAGVERVPGAVTDIAYACGLGHLGRFSGEFKSLFGRSPREHLLAPAV
jgi:AraC-like DNA-binding protein